MSKIINLIIKLWEESPNHYLSARGTFQQRRCHLLEANKKISARWQFRCRNVRKW